MESNPIMDILKAHVPDGYDTPMLMEAVAKATRDLTLREQNIAATLRRIADDEGLSPAVVTESFSLAGLMEPSEPDADATLAKTRARFAEIEEAMNEIRALIF